MSAMPDEPDAASEEPNAEEDVVVPDDVSSLVDLEGEANDPAVELTVEDLVATLETITGERDREFEARARLQADFENYKKRVAKQQQDMSARAAEALVEKLLPVVDALDAAIAHGAEGVEPVRASLLGVLDKEGLERIDPVGDAFDPNRHDAVAHEPGDGGTSVVVEVMRIGYGWQGRVLRPAMVKVKG